MPRSYFTTSWDDGHPADLRVAEMLSRHGLAGTFYIPRTIATGVMSAPQICQISRMGFEIGAHTLGHVLLPTVDAAAAREEIAGSKQWVEQVTALPCRMFCPPAGRFDARHAAIAHEAGFIGMRTVELVSLDGPRRRVEGLMEMPTTIQAFPHSFAAYARNFVKRGAARNLWVYLVHGQRPNRDWSALARRLIERACAVGGVFHLWGHSWELEQTRQWDRLDEVLACIAAHARDAPGARGITMTNGQICESALEAVCDFRPQAA
jgi:peptidoglycan/xylan/chitin deacetylase (PgdA/CDA1 family)